MANEFVIKNGFFSQGASNVTGNLTVTLTVSGTTGQFTTLSASVVSASSLVGVTIPSSPGGTDKTIQFNSGSTLSGSTNLTYDYTTNTLSGTTAQFTTVTASLLSGINYLSTASISNATITFTKGNNTTFPLTVNNVTTALTASSLSIVGGYMPDLIFGDASDGSATLDATASVGWATLSGVIYTMTRDALLGDLTINSGVTLRVANFLPYASGTLTNNGIIEARGNNATGVTAGGAVAAAGTWNSAAGSGGNGGTNSTGSAGAGSGGNSLGGGGGNGGAGGANAGGLGNTSAALVAAATSYRTIGYMFTRRVANANTFIALNGSGGGGGGGSNNAAASGGGGGSAAGLCGVFCNTLVNNGTIQSIGGNGASGTGASGNAGGGGGGAGGPVFVVANNITTQGTIQSVGGSGGGVAGAGITGSNGTASSVIILRGI